VPRLFSGLLFWFTYCINVTFNAVSFTETFMPTFMPQYCNPDMSTPHARYSAGSSSSDIDDQLFWTCDACGLVCSSVSLFLLFIIAYIGAGSFAKVNVILFVGLMISLAVGIGSIMFGLGLDDLPHHTKVLSTVTYPPPEGHAGSIPGQDPVDYTGHFRPFAWKASCATEAEPNCTYGVQTKLWPNPVQSNQCNDEVCNLQIVFSIMFPAVCGMMEGANLSGDLKDPAYSIPYGTIAAITTAFIFYICLIVGQAGSMDNNALWYNMNVMQDACINQYFVVLGVATACLSTSLGSMFGSSRILQAIARDNLIPGPKSVNEFFSVGTLKGDEPRRAVCLTYLISGAAVFIGGLDKVAPILTNFFLLTYSLTNFATFLLEISGLINFRPSWRFYSWHSALLGATLNIVVMFYLNVIYASVTVAIVFAVFIGITINGPEVVWGDISQALMFKQARKYIVSMQGQPRVTKFWRPSMMLLTEDPSPVLLGFCDDAKKGGILVLGKAVLGDSVLAGSEVIERTMQVKSDLLSQIAQAELRAFPHVVAMPNARLACQNLVLSAGMQGAMEPDIIVMPQWDDNAGSFMRVSGSAEYTHILGDMISMGKNLIVACNAGGPPGGARSSFRRSASKSLPMSMLGMSSAPSNAWEEIFTRAVKQSDQSFAPPSIDLWVLPQSFLTPFGLGAEGAAGDGGHSSPSFALLLQVGFILALTRKRKYGLSGASLRVLELVDGAAPGAAEETARVEALRATLKEARIDAEIKIIFTQLPKATSSASIQSGGTQQLGAQVNAVIKQHSATTVVSMMHLVPPPADGASVDECGEYIDNLAALTAGLPLAMLVATAQQDSVITTQI
jgi:amino acid transporter